MTLRRILWLAPVLAICLLYFLLDPAEHHFFPSCFLYNTTGYLCPGCGLQRFLHAFLHLRMDEAFHYHAWAFILVWLGIISVLLRFLLPETVWQQFPGKRKHMILFVPTIILAGTVIFTVSRNI